MVTMVICVYEETEGLRDSYEEQNFGVDCYHHHRHIIIIEYEATDHWSSMKQRTICIGDTNDALSGRLAYKAITADVEAITPLIPYTAYTELSIPCSNASCVVRPISHDAGQHLSPTLVGTR
jgi:hypothetical protein